MKTDFAAACRFFSAEDACRVALAAYYASSRHLEPPPGEPYFDESGAPWASAGDFAEAFSAEIQARVALLALDALGEFYPFGGWGDLDVYKLASEIEPEKMAHIIGKREEEMAAIRAEFPDLFSRDEMNELPPRDNAVHNRISSGVDGA